MKITIQNISDFEYLNQTEFPVLILGIEYDGWMMKEKSEIKYNFAEGREWKKIAHQTAGLSCHQHYIIGTVLKPKNVDVYKKMNILTKKWSNSDCGTFGVSLNELNEYRDDIKTLFGLDCNNCYRYFEEGIYPIDCTQEALEALTKENLPKDLDNLAIWEKDLDKILGCIGRWNLWILGENCC